MSALGRKLPLADGPLTAKSGQGSRSANGSLLRVLSVWIVPLLNDGMIDHHEPAPEVSEIVITGVSVILSEADFDA